MSIIPARNEDVPVCRTKGRYRKEMKRGYSKKKYHQRSKVETIFSVIKRTMGDEIRSVKTVAQNNEMRTKIICYNAARIVDMASSLLRGFLQSRISIKLKYILFKNYVMVNDVPTKKPERDLRLKAKVKEKIRIITRYEEK